jgi:predicted nucleic-acid-binding Zn-ribbon protein
MKRRRDCPECGSTNQHFRGNVDAMGGYGPNLLPGAGGFLRLPKMHVVVCGDCGLIRFFASEKTLERITSDRGWERL